jgi:hypothetical protein
MVSVAPLNDGILREVFQGVRLFYDALVFLILYGWSSTPFSFMP